MSYINSHNFCCLLNLKKYNLETDAKTYKIYLPYLSDHAPLTRNGKDTRVFPLRRGTALNLSVAGSPLL